PMRTRLIALATILLLAAPVTAFAVLIDPGAVGDSFTFRSFDFSDLAGTGLHGQTLSFDLSFTDAKFLVSTAIAVDFFLSQSGALGTFPSSAYALSGSLLDGFAGRVVTDWFKSAEIPAQILGGTFIPTTVGFSLRLAGTVVPFPPNPDFPGGPDYRIDPVVL